MAQGTVKWSLVEDKGKGIENDNVKAVKYDGENDLISLSFEISISFYFLQLFDCLVEDLQADYFAVYGYAFPMAG
jgi:hypothetical protein